MAGNICAAWTLTQEMKLDPEQDIIIYILSGYSKFYLNRMTDKIQHWHEEGVALREAQPKLKRPPMYKVVLNNDDYTPMDFVVHILEIFFAQARENAIRIMLEVHTRGRCICGIFTYEIAETRVSQVNSYSREQQHPLLCTMEKA